VHRTPGQGKAHPNLVAGSAIGAGIDHLPPPGTARTRPAVPRVARRQGHCGCQPNAIECRIGPVLSCWEKAMMLVCSNSH
jgi:hypothetical protein